jgi:hypothetical protein
MGKDKNYRATEAILYKYNYIKGQIDTDKKLLNELEPSLIDAYDYTKVRVQSSGLSDMTYVDAVRFMNNHGRIKNSLKKNCAVIEKVDFAIKYLSAEEQKLIINKYFQRKKDYEVYAILNMCSSTYYRFKHDTVIKISLVIFG